MHFISCSGRCRSGRLCSTSGLVFWKSSHIHTVSPVCRLEVPVIAVASLAEILDAEGITIGLICLVVGVVAGAALIKLMIGGTIRTARREAEGIRQSATTESETIRNKAELDAERHVRERRDSLEKELDGLRAGLKKDQDRLDRREDSLEKKLQQADKRQSKQDRRSNELDTLEKDLQERDKSLDQREEDITSRLADVSSMSIEDAKALLLERVEEQSKHDAAAVRREIMESAEQSARSDSREITLMAIQRFAAEHVADSTVKAVKIPSDDLKGRVIGREGRNIRALERATGVDVMVDDTPGVIAVSCFDPIRRAIAGEALQKLVTDGRVHPSRIEEVVAGVRKDMNERIVAMGNESTLEANIRSLHPKIVEAMGKLHFRTSFGQNVLRHSIEVAYLSQIIADQLGLDGELARRCGFLHDIGKAMDHEMEGGHPAIGMEFAKRYGEKSEAVLNAIGGHHSDIPSTTPYTPIVMAADAVSGARPGARRESMEMYVQRLQQLEGIAKEDSSVAEAFAIQAGREVRVIVNSDRADDDDAFRIAEKIAKRVEEEMTFPGEIKVTVLRETRAEATAR
ncbi:MAG: ribonuclease Y [Phycisphaerae bacterium]|nr:ribonuclease Y [Phycisphaerae bacterium]